MTSPVVRRDLTAIHRVTFSRPVQLALADEFIAQGSSFFDYGCGNRDDVRKLEEMQGDTAGWDPIHPPEGNLGVRVGSLITMKCGGCARRAQAFGRLPPSSASATVPCA